MHAVSASDVQRLAQSATSYFTRIVRSAAPHAADLLQEASLAILQARVTFNPGFTGTRPEDEAGEEVLVEQRWDSYAYRAACIAIRRYLWRNKLPVQVPRSLAETELGITSVGFEAPVSSARGQYGGARRDIRETLPAAEANPFERYAEAQMSMRVARLLDATRKEDPATKLALGRLKTGERPAEFAKRKKVPVADVYASTFRLKRALKRSPEALQLWQEV